MTLVLLAMRRIVQKSVDTSFRRLELELASRAAFADKIHNQKFTLVIEISQNLEKIRSNLERLIDEKVSQEDVAPKGETKGLTEVYEALRVIRVILGKELSALLEKKAFLASVVASNWDELQRNKKAGNITKLNEYWGEWSAVNDELCATVATLFDFPDRKPPRRTAIQRWMGRLPHPFAGQRHNRAGPARA